jgi:hypothetical protein
LTDTCCKDLPLNSLKRQVTEETRQLRAAHNPVFDPGLEGKMLGETFWDNLQNWFLSCV